MNENDSILMAKLKTNGIWSVIWRDLMIWAPLKGCVGMNSTMHSINISMYQILPMISPPSQCPPDMHFTLFSCPKTIFLLRSTIAPQKNHIDLRFTIDYNDRNEDDLNLDRFLIRKVWVLKGGKPKQEK